MRQILFFRLTKSDSYYMMHMDKSHNLQKKPDFRMSGYAQAGTELVCLELEVPNELVLLSDYDDWTFVLNDLYLHDTARETDWEIENEMLESLSEDELRRAKEISWEKYLIFVKRIQ